MKRKVDNELIFSEPAIDLSASPEQEQKRKQFHVYTSYYTCIIAFIFLCLVIHEFDNICFPRGKFRLTYILYYSK